MKVRRWPTAWQLMAAFSSFFFRKKTLISSSFLLSVFLSGHLYTAQHAFKIQNATREVAARAVTEIKNGLNKLNR